MEDNRDCAELLLRLRRIEGQVRGIARMVEDGRSCEEVVVQLSAARSALDQVTAQVVVSHTLDCIHNLPLAQARASIASAILLLTKMPIPALTESEQAVKA